VLAVAGVADALEIVELEPLQTPVQALVQLALA
jgi:hypothetical protein